MIDACTLPRIGLTLDWHPAGEFGSLACYACRQNYVDAVIRAGGLPWALPHDDRLVSGYVAGLDGLLVTSGAFDVDPSYYRVQSRHAATTVKAGRTRFEHALLAGALAADLPVLAVGGGHQLLNVVLGGTLLQHIPDEVPEALVHEQAVPRVKPGHDVRVAEGTLLHRITGLASLPVNSDHHQAVGTVATGVVVSARAEDGIVEAIEAPAYRFVLGVQWAPEFRVTPADDALFTAFVEACRGQAHA